MENHPLIFGIGNPLIDLSFSVEDYDLEKLGLKKGTMALTDKQRQKKILAYLKSRKHNFSPGGSAPNTIIACSGLGVNSHISGKIGNDMFGDMYINRLNDYGADSGLVQGDGLTGSSIILITPDGERTMNTNLGICQDFCIDDINKVKLAKSKYLYFTGYMWDTESQKSAIKEAITIAKENEVTIVFDVADPFVVMRNRNDFIKMIKGDLDIVFANEEEVKILFDSQKVDYAINEFKRIVKTGAIKLGKRGSVVVNNKTNFMINPSKINAKDTTGAGDMYAAGFLSSLARGKNLNQAGKMAVTLAERIIQIQGAQFENTVIRKLKNEIKI